MGRELEGPLSPLRRLTDFKYRGRFIASRAGPTAHQGIPLDVAQLLARFDAEMRARPPPEAGTRVERVGPVVRVLGESCWVSFSQLTSSNARAVIADQTAFFRSHGKRVEWKVYGHDLPPDLGELLREAGYAPDPAEALMVFDLANALEPGPWPTGVEIRRVTDHDGLDTAVAVSHDAFGHGEGWAVGEYARRLADPGLAVLLAYADGVPVASGRLEMPPGRSFASLWGGGTAPSYRGRGIYRTLVAARAEMARGRGYRFLTVDAQPTSRPILERLGFQALTSITGWVLGPTRGGAAGAQPS